MALKTVVKVGRITNLSDARYCSGMGVDMLGFRVIDGQPGYVSSQQFQEMRGWFAGPRVVAEVYGINSHDQLDEAFRNYQPDLIEMTITEYNHIAPANKPLILSLTGEEYQKHRNKLKSINELRYLLLSDAQPELVQVIQNEFPVLLAAEKVDPQHILTLPVSGIALHGSPEEKPGFKSYGNLADVLEKLETD
jgi:phosphoribosylanthranilate isomerase